MSETKLLTLYARREPTTDQMTLKLWPRARCRDTVLYYDRECACLAMIIPWYFRQPRRRQKTIVYNCWRWRLVWVNYPTSEDGGL